MALRDELQSTLGSAYDIERELAPGGMSRVFVAQDATLGRRVVVKILSPDLGGSVSVDRFRREIRLAASLQQANIVPVISAGEMTGLPYYTMPFIEGETLRARLARGPVPERDAVGILRDVARALDFAHERGVVHRDIKPENVLLSGSTAVVTDFGIAKALELSSTLAIGAPLTQAGIAVGTPAYLSPEQAAGDPAVDHRADLYSLGVLAYELLTGKTPFADRSPAAMFAAHVTERPPDIAAVIPQVSPALALLVMRCLEKDPAKRPQSAREVLEHLESTSVTPREGQTSASNASARDGSTSIAVLAFANMNTDPDTEYFSDGISEELINALAQVPAFRVIARTSSFAFKGKNIDVREIGRALGVRYVMEGSVRKAGSALRVTAQLIDATDGTHKWSARYDRSLADTFAIQDEITAAIRDAVGASVLGLRKGTARETDEETYDLYLRGRALLFESSTRNAEAMDLLARATQRDPEFSPALVSLADAYCLKAWFAVERGSDMWQRVRQLAAVVARRDPGSAAAERLAGTLLAWTDRDFAGAERHLRQAIAANPSDVIAHATLAVVLLAQGRTDEADEHNRRMISLDPLSSFSHVSAANNWAAAGRYAEAEAAGSAAIDIDPRYPEGYHMRGYARNYMGKFREAETDLARVPGLGNTTGWPVAKRCIALSGLGRHDEVRSILDELLRRRDAEFVTADAIACVHQLLGQNDAAFEWLDMAVKEQAVWIGFIGCDGIFAPLRRDRRFERFCRERRIPIQPLPPSALDSLALPA